jgi:imidazolonepropionase-like amidohydrolase
MSALQAIVLGTARTAEALGIGQRTGTLEPGKWADILVVDGDPLADIRLLQARERLLLIVRDGRLLVDRTH